MDQIGRYLKSRSDLIVAIGAYILLVTGKAKVAGDIPLFNDSVVISPDAVHVFFIVFIGVKLYEVVVGWIVVREGSRSKDPKGFLSTELSIIMRLIGVSSILAVLCLWVLARAEDSSLAWAISSTVILLGVVFLFWMYWSRLWIRLQHWAKRCARKCKATKLCRRKPTAV